MTTQESCFHFILGIWHIRTLEQGLKAAYAGVTPFAFAHLLRNELRYLLSFRCVYQWLGTGSGLYFITIITGPKPIHMDIDGLSANLCNNGYSRRVRKTALFARAVVRTFRR